MPVHDWTRVSAGVFHHFHTTWITGLARILNGGVLPGGYYAMAEQVAGEIGPDVLTLEHREGGGLSDPPAGGPEGATAVATAPPRVSTTVSADESEVYARKARTLVIRHASRDRAVSLVEIVSPGNKDRGHALERFVDKAISALDTGIHFLAIDLHPPGPHDPDGIHAAIWSAYSRVPYRRPADRPLTLASYESAPTPTAYVEPVSVGSVLPDMPLFLEEGWYVPASLEGTYREAFDAVPGRWREELETSA